MKSFFIRCLLLVMASQAYDAALQAYEAGLQKTPNRFNSLYGAGKAAEKGGNAAKATYYYKALLQLAGKTCTRPELKKARQF